MAELKTFVFTDISGSVRLKDEMTGRSVTERDQAFIHQVLDHTSGTMTTGEEAQRYSDLIANTPAAVLARAKAILDIK